MDRVCMLKNFVLPLCCLLLLGGGLVSAQNVTLVYEPDIPLDAAGSVQFLEERENGELTRRAVLRAPQEYIEFIQRRRSDGGLRRLEWQYDSAVSMDSFIIQEQDSQPDGTWTPTAYLTYRGGLLKDASFYSGENRVEQRLYEYSSAGDVEKELTTRVGDEFPVLLLFERPAESIVEAIERKPDGSEVIAARLQYDQEGRLLAEERFVKGKLNRRDVYSYTSGGKLSEHVRYDYRELPIRHVIYDYTDDGLPVSVVHRDVKDRVLFGVSYSRVYDNENSITTIKSVTGEITGTIDYRRENGRDTERTEVFFLGDGKLEITYSDFDSVGNWLRKELATYAGNSVKDRTITTRIIRYFD